MPGKFLAPIFSNRVRVKKAFKNGKKTKARTHYSDYKKAGGKLTFENIIKGKRDK